MQGLTFSDIIRYTTTDVKIPVVGMGTGEDYNEACNIDETRATSRREREKFYRGVL